jgi:hypothetical protein
MVKSANDPDSQRLAQAYIRDTVIEEEAYDKFHQLAMAHVNAEQHHISEAIQNSLRSISIENAHNLAYVMQMALNDDIMMYAAEHDAFERSSPDMVIIPIQGGIGQVSSGLTSAFRHSMCNNGQSSQTHPPCSQQRVRASTSSNPSSSHPHDTSENNPSQR